MFDNIDFKSFWNESEYINKVCTGENLTDEMVQEAEKRLPVFRRSTMKVPTF